MDLINPIPQEWTKYLTQSPVGLEIVPDQLYDTQTFTDNATTELNFFTAVAANLGLSNMTQPGMLPNPQSFLIEYARLYFRVQVTTTDSGAAGAFASTYNDIVLLVNTGIFKLTIGTKNYGPWLLWTMPSASYAQGVIAVAGAEAANLAHEYAQLGGPLWNLRPNLMIAPLQNFSAQLAWPGGTVNLTGNVVITVMFEGQRARGIQ
jgi:hypothetical protein